ncbi:cobalamin-dependent protein [Mycobacterium sp. M26]|uniref:cobalamin B12-binding domain-containing protein n=1 Tax=Mycobacterium sp. M26 TaxID=1762962 RepID=UPI00073E1868|nr:cobalamin-dependent protein [Mycobacterium sp. M26]
MTVASARARLWDAVLVGDEYAAIATVFDAVDGGMGLEGVLLDVIAPVQYRIGTEWAANRISVTEEHCATAINDRAIAALSRHPSFRGGGQAGRVTVACVDGEWHALPARLLTEVLRLRGWQVDFLGAHVPTQSLIAHVHRHGPDAIALSCMIPSRLPVAHAAITACQAAGVSVLAGGAAFGPDGRYAYQLGANAWAPDARSAAETLARGLPPAKGFTDPQTGHDLAHLADQEFTMVSEMASQLVAHTIEELEHRLPEMRDYSAEQREGTLEDIAHIVGFLTAALYVDDDELFTSFITWSADILSARGAGETTIPPSLDILTVRLQDFPRARRILHSALAALTDLARPAPDPAPMP